MRSGRMNVMQFVEDLLIPKSLAIHDEYSSVLMSLNLGNRQAAACDQTWIVQRYQPVHYQVYPRVQVPRKKLHQNPSFLVFAKEEVFRSQWGAYALWKSARTLEHSCCQCTHKNDGG
ncbi:hypothetical protein TNCV_3853211 [Trichonephila clavipes]|nr:hypothetical protein TNCV_3853211 [Trichonephila clavipes]